MDSQSFNLQLNFKQILKLVKQLPKEKKMELSRELERDIIDKKLTLLLDSFKTEELSEDEINQAVDEVRNQFYAESK